MTRKLLDATLIAILGSLAAAANAQDAPPTDATLDCNEQGCSSSEGVLFRVRSRDDAPPLLPVTGEPSSTPAQIPAQPDASTRFLLDLPGGAAIWATEDPAITQPMLTVQAAPTVPFDGKRITAPVRFQGYTNYGSFIDRVEVVLYRGSDTDLVTPLVTLALPVASVLEAEWDGALPEGLPLETGDELLYVTRAYDRDGRLDETSVRRLRLVAPAHHAQGGLRKHAAVERALDQRVDAEQARMLALEQATYGQDALRVQNIPVRGSRVRLLGRDLPPDAQLTINGKPVPVDRERRFVAEFLEPIGHHRYDVRLTGVDGLAVERTLEVDVSGRYSFLVALADVTVSQHDASGDGAPLPVGREDDSYITDGRLAFYLKRKLQGRYLVTAQADTREQEVRDLFDGFLEAYPQDIFRRLDPDLYYPVHGDDSTTYRDVDTQGRLYVRVDWDRNRLLWGNFDAGLSGTEFAQYQRSLYGAALDWRSRDATHTGEPRTLLKAFGSQARTAPGHSELLGTGGSLYYLRHTDVLPGSDQVVLEVRDRTTGRVEARVELQRGVDYEIDELQGRLVLTRPLAQVTRENVRTLTRDAALDGYEQVLLADYEYVPAGFEADDVGTGLRGRHWLGEHVALGATYVDENRGGEDYRLAGADLTLQAGRGTFLRLEQTRTDATAAPVFHSDNGGLDYLRRNPVAAARSGQARAIEARANLRELGWTGRDWTAGAWWREVDAGFSISRFDRGRAVEEYGAEFLGYLGERFSLFGRYSHAGSGAEILEQAQLTADWRYSETSRFGAELRRVDERHLAFDTDSLLAALSYHHRLNERLELYGIGQATVDRSPGETRNDRLTIGARSLFGERSSIGAELSGGTRGPGAQVDAEVEVGADHMLYGGYRYSTGSTRRDSAFDSGRANGWTFGQRWRLSDRVNLFNEHQSLKDPDDAETGLVHTFGVDLLPAEGWNLGFTVMDGALDAHAGPVDRRAYSVSGGRTDADTQWSSRLEYRRDRGAEQREQWVTSNRYSHRIDDDWRVAGRLQFADTRDALSPMGSARLAEANLGFAWRPHDSTRWAAFGRYTYLYDLASAGQAGGAEYDQRTQVLSLEGTHRFDDRWELAGRFATRRGTYRLGRGTGPWLDSRADFAAMQLRHRVLGSWDGLAEYRWLGVENGGGRRGWLLGVDRRVTEHFRVGVGYNFTDFSDDLTELRYDERGWFLNLAGYY